MGPLPIESSSELSAPSDGQQHRTQLWCYLCAVGSRPHLRAARLCFLVCVSGPFIIGTTVPWTLVTAGCLTADEGGSGKGRTRHGTRPRAPLARPRHATPTARSDPTPLPLVHVACYFMHNMQCPVCSHAHAQAHTHTCACSHMHLVHVDVVHVLVHLKVDENQLELHAHAHVHAHMCMHMYMACTCTCACTYVHVR